MSTETHESHGVAHVMPMKVLINIFLALVVLTVVTVGATLFDFGPYNLYVAMAIAVVKASLVVLYFMHLRYDNPFNSIVFVGCLVFVSLFIGLSLTDTTQYQHKMNNLQAEKVAAPNVEKMHEGGGSHEEHGEPPAGKGSLGN